MYCPNCGFNNENGATFCGNCGYNMNAKTTIEYSQENKNEKYNPWAIAGFVLSLVNIAVGATFIPGVLGLIFSIMGYNQINLQGGKGRGLAVAGIIISIISLVGYVLLFVGLIGLASCLAFY